MFVGGTITYFKRSFVAGDQNFKFYRKFSQSYFHFYEPLANTRPYLTVAVGLALWLSVSLSLDLMAIQIFWVLDALQNFMQHFTVAIDKYKSIPCWIHQFPIGHWNCKNCIRALPECENTCELQVVLAWVWILILLRGKWTGTKLEQGRCIVQLSVSGLL